MIRYLIYLPLNLLCMILCYLTNPVIVLFCDECGELKGFLHLWQTWDDTCDAEDWCTDYSPKWMRYNYYEKYTVHKRLDSSIGKYIKYVTLNPGVTFTIKERFLRYLNRVAWLYRNCAYGFAMHLFGVTVYTKNRKIIKSIYLNNDMNEEYATYGSIFRWYNSLPIKLFPKYRWRIYLGWKINTSLETPQRAMIANRIWFCKREDLK